MKIRSVYPKLIAAALFILAVNLAFGAYTGSTYDEHSSKFSLKNLGTFSKSYSLSYLKIGSMRFVGTQQVVITGQQGDSTVQIQSMMRIQRGNTTFVYPYTYKVRVAKFKTPSPPSPTFR